MNGGQLHQQLKEFHSRYGSVVRIAPNELSYADPKAWEDIYSGRSGNRLFLRNPTWFKKDDANEPQSIMSYFEEDHARFRRVYANSFSDKSLRQQAPVIERYASLFVEQLRSLPCKDVNLTLWFNYFAFDVAGDLSFGESFDCLEKKKAHLWVEIAQDFGKGLALMASLNFYWPLNILLRRFMPKRIVQRGKHHREMSARKAQSRLLRDTDRPDFVTPAKKFSDPRSLISPKEWEINMAVIVFAASETTSSALTAILRELLQHKQVLRKATREVRRAFLAEDEITISSTSDPQKLRNLNAVIREGLRLNPPVVIGIPRIVPEGGSDVCGKWVPGGVGRVIFLPSRPLTSLQTYVTYNQYPANRQHYNFQHPDQFIPDRFLHPRPQDKMESLRPFSAGRHNCIGMNLANAEMRLVLTRLLWAFDLRLTDPADQWDWGKAQNTYVLWVSRHIYTGGYQRGILILLGQETPSSHAMAKADEVVHLMLRAREFGPSKETIIHYVPESRRNKSWPDPYDVEHPASPLLAYLSESLGKSVDDSVGNNRK